MGIHFNNFHKDVGKEAGSGRSARANRHGAGKVEDAVIPQNPSELFEGAVEDGPGVHTEELT